jgi:hypothetical protein
LPGTQFCGVHSHAGTMHLLVSIPFPQGCPPHSAWREISSKRCWRPLGFVLPGLHSPTQGDQSDHSTVQFLGLQQSGSFLCGHESDSIRSRAGHFKPHSDAGCKILRALVLMPLPHMQPLSSHSAHSHLQSTRFCAEHPFEECSRLVGHNAPPQDACCSILLVRVLKPTSHIDSWVHALHSFQVQVQFLILEPSAGQSFVWQDSTGQDVL